MKRIVSVWLPLWPIERMGRHARASQVSGGDPRDVPPDTPLALVESGARGLIITAVNECALGHGVRIGTPLADARAALPALVSRPAEPGRDRFALLKLARWAGRYGPERHIDGADGLWIDITGVAHLFGGEAPLLTGLSRRLQDMGVSARSGLADTLGAAHALARFAATPGRPWAIAPAGGTRAALASLPVEALRLTDDSTLLLKRLGLRRIGQLYDLPRCALERRFRDSAQSRSKAATAAAATASAAVLARLDQALGLAAEPRRSLREPPVLAVRRAFPDPVLSSEILETETGRLAGELAHALARQMLGITRLRLSLYRADGTVAEVRAGLSRASRDAAHMLTLLKEKLATLDAGFGVDALSLEAYGAERMGAAQLCAGTILTSESTHASGDEAAAMLLDRLTGRLGQERVLRLIPRQSHIPERAETRTSALAALSYEPPWPYARGPLRPPLLLSEPEPIAVMAEVPEGPPRSFTWRRVQRRVVRAEGPERIAPEWWKDLAGSCGSACGRLAEGESQAPERTRDYYRIEDETGGTYWVFRDGLYQNASEEGPPRWFLHGIFA